MNNNTCKPAHCLPPPVIWVNRLVLFIIFFWFGFLKLVSQSPAEELIIHLHQKVIAPVISIHRFLFMLGSMECAIGLLWLFPRITKFALIIFLVQMATTFLPLFLLPGDTWKSSLVLTLSGQYILKNIVLVACAFTIYTDCQVKGWKKFSLHPASFFPKRRPSVKQPIFSMKKLLFLAALLAATQAFSQQVGHLDSISGNYKKLAALSPLPNPARAWMDTITFPWGEYSKGALTTSLMRPYYMSLDDEVKLPALIKFPANSSDQTRAELDYLLQLQNSRTKEQIARAEYIANFGSWPTIINPLDSEFNENRKELFYIAAPVIGEWYNPANFPATTQLLMNCIQDIRATEFRLKRYFKRARPYHLEPKLQPLARITSPSFASGHSLWSFTEAYIFSEIIPAKRDAFLQRAEEVRWSRELMGIHYPSDNEASRVIGWYLLSFWYKNPLFVADLEKAKMEWAAKGK